MSSLQAKLQHKYALSEKGAKDMIKAFISVTCSNLVLMFPVWMLYFLAREEFLEKGYSEASLRTIAAKADTTTGSIYSRFGDKEGLFCAIVEPAAEGLTQIFLKTQEAFHAREAEEQPKVMEDYVVGGMDEMLDYVYDRFDDFRLLLDASYGTKYQDFVEHLVDIETEYTYKYMEATKFLQEGSMITEEFLHIMARAMFDSMFEVVRHRMDRDTARKYLHMLEKYHYGGWGAIIKLG